MKKGENKREGKGKDINTTTGKGERKLKEKEKKGKEESKEKASRRDEVRRGEEEDKYVPKRTFYLIFTRYRLRK